MNQGLPIVRAKTVSQRPVSDSRGRTIRYFDLKRHWTKRVVPHLADEDLNRILVRDFNRFTFGRWGKQFKTGELPEQYESADWRWNHRGKYPRFWSYVKLEACHWIANFSLRLAQLVEPKKPWRIITSDEHSTVWDGAGTLFDFNFQALGLPAVKAWQAARGRNTEELPVGVELETYYSTHFLELEGQ
jgi:hypothetical protein